MTPLIITIIAVFFASLGLLAWILYLILVAPAENKALRSRLEAIQEYDALPSTDLQAELLRQEVLSDIPAIDQLLFQIEPLAKLNLILRQAAVRITVARLLLYSLIFAIMPGCVALLFTRQILLILLAAAAGASIPFIIIAIKRQRRFSKFEEQFPDAIDLLARAVRAGHAYTTGFELIGTEMAEPLAGEFRRTFEQQNLGLPLRDALQNLMIRMPLPDVQVFVTALVIQREAGGNLAEILDNLAHIIRERFKLMRQVKVFTAQGRMSLYVLTALPPMTVLLLFFLNSKYILRLFTDPLGHKFLAVGIVMQFLGYMVIRKIIQPKV
jgi:tight adherence protein B